MEFEEFELEVEKRFHAAFRGRPAAVLPTPGARWLSVSWGIVAASAVAVLAGVLALRATRSRCVHFPSPAPTVGDLARYAAAYGSPLLSVGAAAVTRSQAREVVHGLMRFELDVEAVRDDAPWDRQSPAPAIHL